MGCYYEVGITKTDNFITKCNRYYRKANAFIGWLQSRHIRPGVVQFEREVIVQFVYLFDNNQWELDTRRCILGCHKT